MLRMAHKEKPRAAGTSFLRIIRIRYPFVVFVRSHGSDETETLRAGPYAARRPASTAAAARSARSAIRRRGLPCRSGCNACRHWHAGRFRSHPGSARTGYWRSTFSSYACWSGIRCSRKPVPFRKFRISLTSTAPPSLWSSRRPRASRSDFQAILLGHLGIIPRAVGVFKHFFYEIPRKGKHRFRIF